LEDLTQSVAVKLWTAELPDRNLNRDELAEYLLAWGTIAGRRLAIDIARRRRPQTNTDALLDLAPDLKSAVRMDSERFQVICEAVRRVTEKMPEPPPKEFVAGWYNLFQLGVEVSEERVGVWQREFGKGRATIYRWINRLKMEVRNRVTL